MPRNELRRDDLGLVRFRRQLLFDAHLRLFANVRLAPLIELCQLGSRHVTQLAHFVFVLVQRVCGEVDTNQVFLFVEPLDRVPPRHLG